MFVGEMCCIIGYFYVKYKQKKEHGDELSPDEKDAVKKGLILNYSPLWFAIPAMFDVVSSTLMYVGLFSVEASVMQIINCTTLIWIAVFSMLYLKRRYSVAQFVGLGALLAGVGVVAYGSILKSSGSSSGGSSLFGVVCLVLGMMFAGLLMVAEEKIFSKFYAHPLQVVGCEGATGVGVYTVLLFIMYYIPCTPNPDSSFCPYGKFEDTPRALKEIFSNGLLLFVVIATITSLGSFNFFGVSLTKFASATHRGAVNSVRPFTVWLVCLIIQWETFSYVQLIGYIISVYGMVVYYGILPLNPANLCKSADEPELESKLETEGENKAIEASAVLEQIFLVRPKSD